MQDIHRNLLRENLTYLQKNLEVSSGFLAVLYSKDVINDENWETLKEDGNSRTNSARVDKFYEVIIRKGPKAYAAIIEALKETRQHHIYDKLQDEEKLKMEEAPEGHETKSSSSSKYSSQYESILSKGALLKLLDIVDISPLKINRLQKVVDEGLDVNKVNRDGLFPIQDAVDQGQSEVVSYLLHKGCNIEVIGTDKKNLLHRAARKGHIDIMEILINAGVSPCATDAAGNTAVHVAWKSGHNHAAAYLITKEKIDVNLIKDGDYNGNALHLASRYGDVDSISWLLRERKFDISAEDDRKYTALHWACINGNKDAVKLLLNMGANTAAADIKGDTALQKASLLGRSEVVKLLQQSGANISAVNKNGDTALHEAAKWGQITAVASLLGQGADPTAADKDGETALHLAAKRGHADVVSKLLEQGADVNAVKTNGDTALHRAALRGEVEVVELLLKGGAMVDMVNNKGETALHLAAWGLKSAVVKLLLMFKADVSILNEDGNTAESLAAQRADPKHVEILELLKHAS